MYKLGHLENNGQNQDVSQCNSRDVFTGHNMSNSSCSLSSPPSDIAAKSSTTSVLRRWRRPESHDSSKNVQAKDVPTNQPTKYVNPTTVSETEKQMNQVGNYETSSSGSDYSMFVPQLSPLVHQSTAGTYDSTKYLPHVQYSENGGYARTSPVVPPSKEKTIQSSYYHQENTNQEVHFRSPSYPIQNTPPLAHSSSQKCILPNENNYPTINQKVQREYNYPHRDYSVVAHNYSPQKNTGESKISPQGVTEDPSYCLSKGGYLQDSRNSYPLQNVDRRVSPTKSPIYRNYSQNNTQNYPTTNTNYYLEKPTCSSQKQYSEKPVLDARYVQNYNTNYVVKNTLTNSQDPKHYRNVISNSKKSSPPFPILEQRLNQGEPNYCTDYTAQGYPAKYGPLMFSRTSPIPKIVRDTSHNYISPNVHHNPKIPAQEVMIPSNYSFPNKYYQQNQGQEWKIPKEYEQNMYLSQMNQMHARLPNNTISKTAELPRDLSYVDQNQRMVQKNRMYENPVEHLQYTGKSVVPVTQKSPKMVGYNIADQRTLENDYLNLPRPCGTVLKPNDYQRSKVNEYSPVIQSVKSAEIGLSRDYLMHQQACDQQTYACSPPLVQNSRNPPSYPVGYPRQSNIKMNEMPARNISPRRTFQENMPVVVFSPQHIGLPKSSPNQMYPTEFPNQHYPGYYARDSVYPSGVKPGTHQYPVDQTKYPNIQVNRNVPQQRFYGYPEHQYYQHKHPESTDKISYYPGNMYRTNYNHNLPEHLQQNAARAFEDDYRNAASNYNDFETNRVDDRSIYSKKDSDIGKSLKEFLESWEDDEEIVANLPDLVLCNNIPPDKQKLPFASEEVSESSKSSSDDECPKETEAALTEESQPLYILGSTNISSEALPQYLAVYEQVDRLPDNIKGFYKDPCPNNNEESQSVVENTEKPVEKVPTEPKSVIRESLSPHDLTVNKNRKEEKADEEEVLNLSTNRNKENNEFLVEEYSNASDSSVQESPKSQGTEMEITVEEPDTNYSETEKLSEVSCEVSPKENVTNIVEPTEDKQEPIKNTDLTEKITEKLVQETQENVQEAQENVQEDLQENEVVLKGEPPKCPLMMPIRNSEPEKSEIEKDELLEIRDKEDEQPKVPSESTTEKSLTTSVIVENTFFDNASLNNKNEHTDKLPEKIKDPEETKTLESTVQIIPEIQPEESNEKSELSEKSRKEEITEIVENDTAALNTNANDSEEIEDYQITFEIPDSELEEDKIKNSFDVIDFDTTEIIPPVEDKTDTENQMKEIEDHPEEIVPISFDNLINSPENIEMKDDEANISEFENTASKFNDIKSSSSTPKAIDLSDVSELRNISEISEVSDLQHISQVSVAENVPETEEKTSLTPITEEANCEGENSNFIETKTLDVCTNQNDFKNVSEQPNVALDDNSRENVKDKEDVLPENVEIQANEENEVLKSFTDEKISKENKNREISETIDEENKKDIAATSVPNLSSIPDFHIPEDIQEIEQSSIDYTNTEVDKIEESTVNYVDEKQIEPSSADHSNTQVEDIEETIINFTDKQEINSSLTDLNNTEVDEIKEPIISSIDKEQIESTSITDFNTELENIETSTFIDTDTEIVKDAKSPVFEEFIMDIKEENISEEMESKISNTHTEIVEDLKRPIIDYNIIDIKVEMEEQVPEEVELDNPQINQEFVDNEKIFESTVDKLIITNVETIEDDSTDSITEEESITEPASQENNVMGVINSSIEEITAASEKSDTLIDEVQDLFVPEVLELADTKQNEDDTREECNKSSQDDAEAEYAHLIEIENSEDILKETEKELPQINLENMRDTSDKTRNENTNFDFSYLESCTDNICEKHEDRTVDLGNNNSENKINLSVMKKEHCNNLKSILDSSESESENPKEKETYIKEITNEKECTELEKTPEGVVGNQSDSIAEENLVLENNKTSEKSDHTEIIDETKILVSTEVEQFPETIVQENNKESTETVPETEILIPVPEIDFSTREIEPPTPEIKSPTPEIKPPTHQKEPEIIENSSEVPDAYPECPENTTAIVPVDIVRGNQVILTDPVIVTKGESSEESIILPENLTCVLLYEENQPYFIIDSDSTEEEMIPADESVLQETELIIPEMSSELLKEDDIIVDQVTAEKSVPEELLIPELSSEVELQKNEEILTAEPIGEEVIICEEGIEDWVQNEEIIQNNEDEENIETKQLETVEEKDLKRFNNVEENFVENEEQSDMKKIQETNEENKAKFALEKKILIEKRKEKLERFKKLKQLEIKQTTETFLGEEKTNTYSCDEMRNNVEEKELFMNPENPDTIEYLKKFSNNSFPESSSVIKRSVSYDQFQSPKIDFKAPKRRYSTMENCRSVKKQIINLDEISKNITEVLENLTKQETLHYQKNEEIKIEPKIEVRKDNTEPEIKERIKTNLKDTTEENITVQQINVDITIDKEITIKNDIALDVKHVTPSECNNPKIEETNSTETQISDCISPPNNVTKFVEQLIKPKLIIPKTNYNLVATQENKPVQNRKPSLPKTPEEDNSSPIVNTARLTEPIFPKSSKSSIPETKNNPKIVDPRIERSKEPEKEEKPYTIENKFSLTEYTKNYIKMKTGQTVDPKNLCGVNGNKTIDPRLTKSGHQTVKDKVNSIKKKHQNVDNGNSKSNQKKVKINLQDYRNRKQSLSSSDLNVSTENSVSPPQIEDVVKKDSKENNVESSVETNLEGKADQQKKIQKVDKEISDRKVEKLIIKPKKSLDSTSKDPVLIPEVIKVTTNPEEPKETNNTNNLDLDCKNLQNVNSKSKIDLKQSKPKKRKRRFRNLYTVDEEDEIPTKQQKNSQDNKTSGMLMNDDSTSSKISDSSLKANEDSQSSEMSSSTNGDFMCCLDMNSNGSSENNCGFKCHIKLNAIGEKIRDYEINKNSSCNPNRLKLTLTPVKNKKPAFSDVLSNLDSLVESKLLSKRHKHKLNSKSKKSGDGTMWTINNKVPKVIIKRNGSGYCAVFRDVSSNPIWQPKIRLKRQKYIESLVLRSNVKV